jgi:hypothetical protein
MRISSNPDDSHFHPNFANCRIYLEGSERSNVMTADEAARFAVVYKLDEWGKQRLDKNGRPLTEAFHGAVRVDCASWLREAMEAPQDEDDSGGLSVVIYGICP